MRCPRCGAVVPKDKTVAWYPWGRVCEECDRQLDSRNEGLITVARIYIRKSHEPGKVTKEEVKIEKGEGWNDFITILSLLRGDRS